MHTYICMYLQKFLKSNPEGHIPRLLTPRPVLQAHINNMQYMFAHLINQRNGFSSGHVCVLHLCSGAQVGGHGVLDAQSCEVCVWRLEGIRIF